MWYQLIKMIPQKMRMVEVMSRKTLLMLRNLWYFDEREPQVPRDIILAPETNGIFLTSSANLNLYCMYLAQDHLSYCETIP